MLGALRYVCIGKGRNNAIGQGSLRGGCFSSVQTRPEFIGKHIYWFWQCDRDVVEGGCQLN